MAEDVLPLQDADLREALHIGLKPDGPGGGGGEKGCSAPFQKSEGGAVSLAPRAACRMSMDSGFVRCKGLLGPMGIFAASFF